MLRIIDRYLLRQYVQVVLICFVSLSGLYIVIDAFENLDRFVDHAEENGNLLGTLVEHYAYQMLAFSNRMSGILALIGAMFTVTWIQRHQEMTALLAAGIPRLRVLRPVLVGAIFLSLAAAANRELVIPQIRHRLAADSKNLGGAQENDMQARFDSQTDILLGGEKTVLHESRIVRPNFILPPELNLYGKQLTAREAQYLPAAGERPGGYLLRGVTAPKLLLENGSLQLNNTPVVVTPQDANWLKEDEVFVVSGVSFEFLAAGSTWRDYASTRELVHELRSPSTDLGADVRVAIHSRILQPFLDTTLLFLGLPLVVSRGNRNPFLAIGLCLAVVATFMLVVLGCQSLGASGWIRPALAAWFPLMLFAPVAVAMSEPLRR